MLSREEKGKLKLLEEVMKFDDYAFALATIDTNHRHVHDGLYFHASGRSVDIATAASFDLLFTLPAGCRPHVQDIFYNISDSPIDIFVYEGVTTSADGTAVPTFNRNRNSSNTPNMVLTHTPTVTDLGTQIHEIFHPDAGGVGSNLVGSAAGATNEEWIWKPETKYLVRLTNNSGGAITIGFETRWYEIGYVKN